MGWWEDTRAQVSRTSTSTSPRTAAVGSGGWIAFPRSIWPARTRRVTSRSSVRRAVRTHSGCQASTTRATPAARHRPCRPRCRRPRRSPCRSAPRTRSAQRRDRRGVERPDHGPAVGLRHDPRLRRPAAGRRLRSRLLRRGPGGRRCTQRRRNRRTSPAGTSSAASRSTPTARAATSSTDSVASGPSATPSPSSPPAYFPGWDIARDIIVLPTSTATNPAGYVIDAWAASTPSARPQDHPGRPTGRAGTSPATPSPTPTGRRLGPRRLGRHPPLRRRAQRGRLRASGTGGTSPAPTMDTGPKGLAGYVLDGWGGTPSRNNAAAPTTTKTCRTRHARYLALTPYRARFAVASLPGSPRSQPGSTPIRGRLPEAPGSTRTGSPCR